MDDTLFWAGGSRRLCATTRVVALQSVDIGRACVFFVFRVWGLLVPFYYFLHLLIHAAGGLFMRKLEAGLAVAPATK